MEKLTDASATQETFTYTIKVLTELEQSLAT